MKNLISFLLLVLVSFLYSFNANATHIIGGEIGYTHVSGNTYEIKVTLYGDCAGSAFPSLPSAIPHIEIYKDNVGWSYIDLSLTGPGVEVTPVCPAEINNTTCVNSFGTIPGVMRFIYAGFITLDGPANEWSFVFNSLLGGNSAAGRTNAITNIYPDTRMVLIATLNNMNGPNNSSIFTTIPTPFFCINMAQEYNQGAADADADQLSFSLVPGIAADNSGAIAGNVSYIPPYTYLNPLAVVPGSFIFNTTTGQMSFTANMLQTSLVVNKVTEKRGGVVVGTAMREMNLVVLNNCNNQSPIASIPTSTVGAFDTSRTITLCNASLNPKFVINASDPDNQNVTVTVSGLPAAANYSVAGNGTTNPIITINWSISQPLVPGTYNFYVNVQDDGCPFTSKQTFAYTVILIQPFTTTIVSSTNETCDPGSDGSIQINTTSVFGGVNYSLNGAGFQSSNLYSGLIASTYTVIAKDASGCTISSLVAVNSSPLPIVTYSTDPESCSPGNDGSIIASASSANGPIMNYSLNGGAAQLTGNFGNLSTGVYTVTATDNIGCRGKAIITLEPAIIPIIANTQTKNISCFGESDGKIYTTVTPSGLSSTYILNPGNLSNNTGVFDNLPKGNYTIMVVTNKSCSDTAYATLTEPDKFEILDLDINNATCDKSNGTIEVLTNFSTSLIYTLRPATYINTDGRFTDVAPGLYTVTVRDSNFCTVDSVIYLGAEPNLFNTTTTHKDLNCNGWGFEGEAEVFASGGVEPYTYLWTTSPTSSDKKISNLYYGWYFVNVTDALGCETDDTVYINPGPCCESVYIPNAFTPNSDGENDQWKLVTSTGLNIEQFAVFNRWGEKVWFTRDQRASWDGKQNGADVQVGTYFYLLRYRCLTDGKMYVKKGDITVLR